MNEMNQQNRSPAQHVPSTHSPQSKHQQAMEQSAAENRELIKRNLEDKKKNEDAIEKMSVGGDRLILDTIGKQIQFAKEKEFIYKLLIGQAMNNSQGKAGAANANTNLILS